MSFIIKMNKNITILICCILLLFTASACEKTGWSKLSVTIENKTNDTVFFAHDGIRLKAKYYFVHKQLHGVDMVLPNSFTIVDIPRGYIITNFTFVKQTILNEYSEQEIIDKELVDCYAYTHSMLESKNYTIVYNGGPQQDCISIKEEQYEK